MAMFESAYAAVSVHPGLSTNVLSSAFVRSVHSFVQALSASGHMRRYKVIDKALATKVVGAEKLRILRAIWMLIAAVLEGLTKLGHAVDELLKGMFSHWRRHARLGHYGVGR